MICFRDVDVGGRTVNMLSCTVLSWRVCFLFLRFLCRFIDPWDFRGKFVVNLHHG